jgi:predicted DNA-binding transcriptional regulator AlpA
MSQQRLVRISGVVERVGLGKSTIYARRAAGLFPEPISVGGVSVAWIESEVDAIVDAFIHGASEDDIRALVKELHRKRNHKPDAEKNQKYAALVATRKKPRRKAATA